MGRAEGATLSFTTIADPTVSSLAVTDAGQTTATLRGSLDSAGGGVVSATGFKYSTAADLSGSTAVAGSATSGTFTHALSGLAQNTTYHYSAYATNEAGTSYGDTLSFSTVGPCNGATTVDYLGYTYDIVEIGNQCWFAENLRNSTPSLGPCAPEPVVYTSYSDGGGGAYTTCTDADYLSTYGYLYPLSTTAAGTCPTGWSVPTYANFNTLLSSVGNNASALMSTTGWGASLSSGGTNSSGFNALPGGATDDDGFGGTGPNNPFSGVGQHALFVHQPALGMAFHIWLTGGSPPQIADFSWWTSASGGGGGPNMASIRCIKD